MTNRIAPAMPKKSIGLRPKRSWNQTERRSNRPTGIRRQPNLDVPAFRGCSGTGSESSRNPSAAAITTMYRCQSGPERDAVHDLAAVGLDRVEIGDPDPEQPAAEPVVDAGDERLLVLSLLGAGDDVRPVVQDRPHQAGNVGRQVLEVGGIEDEHIPAGDVAGRAERVGDAALAAMGDHPEEGVLPLQARGAPGADSSRDPSLTMTTSKLKPAGPSASAQSRTNSGRLGASSLAGTRTLTSSASAGRVIRACACGQAGCRADRDTWPPCAARSVSPAPGRDARSAGR